MLKTVFSQKKQHAPKTKRRVWVPERENNTQPHTARTNKLTKSLKEEL